MFLSGSCVSYPHPCVVESESVERQLVVEVLVELRIGGVNIPLVVTALIVIGSLVKEPVEEGASDLSQTLRSNYVALALVVGLWLFGCHTVIWVCWSRVIYYAG